MLVLLCTGIRMLKTNFFNQQLQLEEARENLSFTIKNKNIVDIIIEIAKQEDRGKDIISNYYKSILTYNKNNYYDSKINNIVANTIYHGINKKYSDIIPAKIAIDRVYHRYEEEYIKLSDQYIDNHLNLVMNYDDYKKYIAKHMTGYINRVKYFFRYII